MPLREVICMVEACSSTTAWLLALTASLLLAAHADAGDIVLAKAGKSEYAIVVPEKASPSEKHAATELQTFLKEVSGAKLPLITAAGDLPPKMIVIGDGAPLRSLDTDVDLTDLGDEGFVIKTVGAHLVIAGGRLRGTMYGVYTFLEDVLGCRWYAPDASYIPNRSNVTLASLDIVGKPDFEYREPYYETAADPDWAARNKVNGNSMRLDEARGWKVVYGRFCHTFDEIVPTDKYFDEHPEYFSLVNGERVGGQYKGQLCLTNPDVLEIAKKTVLLWIDQNPKATIFSVTQNDNANYCTCDSCKAVDEQEGSPSGLTLRFANAVAEEIATKHPDKLIDTFAYWYTEKPPKLTKPRPNVRVRLCPIYCCLHHDFEKCEKNASFMQYLRTWSKLTDTLYIWHYTTNFWNYLLPLPDLDQLAASIRMYERHGVRGIFTQGMEPGGRPFMGELKAYLAAKLLWNAHADPKAVISEFLDGYYGKAGKPIGKFLDVIHEKVRADNIHGSCFDGLDGLESPLKFHPQSQTTLYLPPEVVSLGKQLLDEADKLADNEEVRARVKRVRLSLDCVEVMRQLKNAHGGSQEQKTAALDRLNQFARDCESQGITNWAAGAGTVRNRCEALTEWLDK